MIYITQLIYIHPGMEKTFEEFESVALPLIDKYNGKLLLRVRPEGGSMVGGELDLPYEIHLVSFEGEEDFERFKADPSRAQFLHLKDKSVRRMMLVKGIAL
ncbi:DUF1330 domain-containing protein [Chitinophaga barathri]|uniref:DUF1330 domain-containing protein n=1 Tax=Chitinophaga barathri TaxID=1647451 RepID=A0A3N4MLI5_9BACT|nr:DUF1330 domain-containing protein [Chitinophaga barathri]RPD42926.1 DUF1330 domain-containing protein [Chitinophaga barathri]